LIDSSTKILTHIAGHWWLTPVILATQEAEIMRIVAQRKPGQIVYKTLYQKIFNTRRDGGVAQGVV
jgi:hypothetical protein